MLLRIDRSPQDSVDLPGKPRIIRKVVKIRKVSSATSSVEQVSAKAAVFKSVADLLMPRVCLVCGAMLGDGEEGNCGAERFLCRRCTSDIPFTRFWKLRDNPMSRSFNDLIQKGMGEDVRYVPYGYAAALYFYKDGFREISKALKYRRHFAAGRLFSAMLGDKLLESPLFRDVDLVVPVPLHWTRKLRRGYNQAEVIAKEVAKRLKAPFCAGYVKRSRITHSQTKLGSEERAHNVTDAFSLTAKGRAILRGPCTPKHILICDDVFTTGATAAACALAFINVQAWQAALFHAGHSVRRISVATLAAVER